MEKRCQIYIFLYSRLRLTPSGVFVSQNINNVVLPAKDMFLHIENKEFKKEFSGTVFFYFLKYILDGYVLKQFFSFSGIITLAAFINQYKLCSSGITKLFNERIPSVNFNLRQCVSHLFILPMNSTKLSTSIFINFLYFLYSFIIPSSQVIK